MTAMHTAQQRFVTRAWLHRHGFTAARLVEDLAHAAASAHGTAEAGHVEREDAELARLVEDLRGWIQRAEGYVARREGDR